MQLHEFVDVVTSDEPQMSRTADDIIAAGRRAERRRRAGFASAGAAGLAAVAVAGAFVLPGFGGARNTSATTSPVGAATSGTRADRAGAAPLTFTFRGYDAGTLHVQDPIVASAAYEIAPVYSDRHSSNDKPQTEKEAVAQGTLRRDTGGKPLLLAYLTVYRPGAFNPAGIKDGTGVTVAGRRAVQATLPTGLDEKRPTAGGNRLFAWEYADNAWAAVTSYSADRATPSFADLGGLVGGLRPVAPRPAPVPFTVSYVPDGYAPSQVGTHALAGLAGVAVARDGSYGGAMYTRPAAPTSGLTAPFDAAEGAVRDGFRISVVPSTGTNSPPKPGATECYQPRQRTAYDSGPAGGFCSIASADGKVVIEVGTLGLGNKLTRAEVERVAKGITVADVKDESTWTPAADALQPR